ncbi:hypothetical protein FGO68_gene2686 [Halteria grandinella]|uniref:Uncharacterized protein n=1 Tax=Halteria grandinella TaxID=5974 RepID=A0A8J8P5D5_HALGN|nr:hypothetical protein FGO68_gene2686 [Halteria grandinella]
MPNISLSLTQPPGGYLQGNQPNLFPNNATKQQLVPQIIGRKEEDSQPFMECVNTKIGSSQLRFQPPQIIPLMSAELQKNTTQRSNNFDLTQRPQQELGLNHIDVIHHSLVDPRSPQAPSTQPTPNLPISEAPLKSNIIFGLVGNNVPSQEMSLAKASLQRDDKTILPSDILYSKKLEQVNCHSMQEVQMSTHDQNETNNMQVGHVGARVKGPLEGHAKDWNEAFQKGDNRQNIQGNDNKNKILDDVQILAEEQIIDHHELQRNATPKALNQQFSTNIASTNGLVRDNTTEADLIDRDQDIRLPLPNQIQITASDVSPTKLLGQNTIACQEIKFNKSQVLTEGFQNMKGEHFGCHGTNSGKELISQESSSLKADNQRTFDDQITSKIQDGPSLSKSPQSPNTLTQKILKSNLPTGSILEGSLADVSKLTDQELALLFATVQNEMTLRKSVVSADCEPKQLPTLREIFETHYGDTKDPCGNLQSQLEIKFLFKSYSNNAQHKNHFPLPIEHRMQRLLHNPQHLSSQTELASPTQVLGSDIIRRLLNQLRDSPDQNLNDDENTIRHEDNQ